MEFKYGRIYAISTEYFWPVLTQEVEVSLGMFRVNSAAIFTDGAY